MDSGNSDNEGSAALHCYAAMRQNVWIPDLYRELAEEYCRVCEEYDRTVCTGSRDGVAMPMTGREAGLINRNAKQVLNQIAERACEELGKPLDAVLPELRRAIRAAA